MEVVLKAITEVVTAIARAMVVVLGHGKREWGTVENDERTDRQVSETALY
jgi:hypothetical protein